MVAVCAGPRAYALVPCRLNPAGHLSRTCDRRVLFARHGSLAMLRYPRRRLTRANVRRLEPDGVIGTEASASRRALLWGVWSSSGAGQKRHGCLPKHIRPERRNPLPCLERSRIGTTTTNRRWDRDRDPLPPLPFRLLTSPPCRHTNFATLRFFPLFFAYAQTTFPFWYPFPFPTPLPFLARLFSLFIFTTFSFPRVSAFSPKRSFAYSS